MSSTEFTKVVASDEIQTRLYKEGYVLENLQGLCLDHARLRLQA